MEDSVFCQAKHIHLVGIGGIGVSAIARMMLEAGKEVSGSDQARSPLTNELKRLGARIFFGHQPENLSEGVELVVYSTAVPPDNPELAKARQFGIPVLSYPEMLGRVTKDKYTIAVAGTHGKTTTTAMLAEILIAAGFDPTVIIGSLFLDQRSNFIAGQSRYFLVEACEYRRSFLNLSPKILVITNIDNDHLDYYRDLADIQSAFAELAAKVPDNGWLVVDRRSSRLAPVFKSAHCQIIDYRSGPDKIKLTIPGRHNLLNAQAALAAARAVGIDEKLALSAVEGFRGTWRRFEYQGRFKTGALVYDDYAHHPTEIKATLAAAKEIIRDRGKIIVIFQPHLYSRTKLLFDEFARSFADAAAVIITPIYAAREPPDQSVSSAALAQAVVTLGRRPARYLENSRQIVFYLEQQTGPADLIVIMGAGDIFALAENLV